MHGLLKKVLKYTYRFLPHIVALALALSAIFLFIYLHNGNHQNDPLTPAFSKLDKIRRKKVRETARYLQELRVRAEAITEDRVMVGYFQNLQAPQTLVQQGLEYEIDKRFVDRYGAFYDILFIDKSGLVFHSIKQESDYKKCIFEGDLGKTKLAANLKDPDNRCFVDFQYYKPSDEPAAFFIVPVTRGGKHGGWFVLQCAINRINIILTDRRELGRSGEVYLVNEGAVMLSESRFTRDCSILRQNVNTEAVQNGKRYDRWRGIIKDYRGVRVLSTVEKFSVFGINWIVAAEIDESEVITGHYKKYHRYFRDRIFTAIRKTKTSLHKPPPVAGQRVRVDVNELARAEPGTILETRGIATCTGISAFLPDTSAYLVHLSPTDNAYKRNILTRFFLGRNSYDLIGEIVRKIRKYDIYQYQMREVQFVVVATHDGSFENTVGKLLEAGVELANIRFIYNPDAQSANVSVDTNSGVARTEWVGADGSSWSSSKDYANLENVLKKVIDYNELVKNLDT